MTTRLDYMFAEVDRQLDQAQARADALVQRAGLLISANAVVASIFAANLDQVKGGEIATFIVLGLSMLAGIGVILPSLVPGPKPSKLTNWATGPATPALTALYDAKVTALENNLERLVIMTVAFYLEVVTVIAAAATALVATAGR